MPLHYIVTETLNVPDEAYNSDGLAVLIISGGRYGGDWFIAAVLPEGDIPCGRIQTSTPRKDELVNDPRYPDLAIDSACIWLWDYAHQHSGRLVSWENINAQFDAGARPYMCLARAILASPAFVPAPGAVYADELIS